MSPGEDPADDDSDGERPADRPDEYRFEPPADDEPADGEDVPDDEASADASADESSADAPAHEADASADAEPDDEVFHPLGEEWQRGLEDELEASEYDADLGVEMARDAMRVTKGELSEAEFHDRYHEDVLEEFGVDDRPTEDAWDEAKRADEGVLDSVAELVGGETNRRETMKKMGAAGAAVGLGGVATAQNAQDNESEGGDGNDLGTAGVTEDSAEESAEDGTQWGMVIDLDQCDGCLSCVVACQQEHNWNQGANWMYVLAYDDETIPGSDEQVPNRLVRPCQHCTDAPCEKVCPTTARHTRDAGGLVLTDYDICIGCRYCQVACPYGVNYFQWGEPDVPQSEIDDDHVYDDRGRPVASRAPRGVMEKCTFCPQRQDGNMGEEQVGTTACEEACPPQIIHFGDMNDPESRPRQALDETQEGERDDSNRASSFKLLEEVGTNPNVIYLGDQPGANAHQISQEEAQERGLETAVTYEAVDQVDERKHVTDEGTLGGDILG